MSAAFAVRLTPRGGRDAIEGVAEGGVLRCRVAAAPVEGAANASLVRLLAEALGLPRGSIAIVGGATARTKRVALEGVAAADLVERWPGLVAREG